MTLPGERGRCFYGRSLVQSEIVHPIYLFSPCVPVAMTSLEKIPSEYTPELIAPFVTIERIGNLGVIDDHLLRDSSISDKQHHRCRQTFSVPALNIWDPETRTGHARHYEANHENIHHHKTHQNEVQQIYDKY